MSHVADGTLHAYLDAELSPAEARSVDAHLAQCPDCHTRLEEERALIARADELLGRAAPPERAVPPFRAGDLKPPVRLWWHVRVPLAWAATLVLALGIGMYFGSGSTRLPTRVAESRTNLADRAAPPTAVAPQAAAPQASRELRVPARPQPTSPTAAPAPPVTALRQADRIGKQPAFERAAREAVTSPAAAPAVSGPVDLQGTGHVIAGPPLSRDAARALLGMDPLAVPGLTVRGIYSARLIGYSPVVVIEQALDSGTTIQVINGRPGPPALEADSLARLERKAHAAPARAQDAMADRRTARLFLQVRGPVSADSLAALQRQLQPLRP